MRTPKDGERYFALVKVDKVNGMQPEAIKHRIMFENLTPLHPNEVMTLERDIKSEENIVARAKKALAIALTLLEESEPEAADEAS